MITLREFKDGLDAIREYEEFIDSAIKIGIDLINCDKITKLVDVAIDGLANGFPTIKHDARDFIEWWLYESTSKLVKMPDGSELTLATPDDLYNFLEHLVSDAEREAEQKSSEAHE